MLFDIPLDIPYFGNSIFGLYQLELAIDIYIYMYILILYIYIYSTIFYGLEPPLRFLKKHAAKLRQLQPAQVKVSVNLPPLALPARRRKNHGGMTNDYWLLSLPSGYLTQPWKINHFQQVQYHKSSMNGPCSIAMLNNQRVYDINIPYDNVIVASHLFLPISHRMGPQFFS